MSNDLKVSQTAEKLVSFMLEQKDHFVEINKSSLNPLNFAKECEFAKQLLMKNDYLMDVARSNPDSLQQSIANVAGIGISLNPAHGFCYLVPRKKDVCLDISYKGLIKLATDTGAVRSMKAELVYENDTYKYRGWHVLPEFYSNPFSDRGAIIGVYCLAILTDGSPMVENMTIEQVLDIRNDSEAYKSALQKGNNSYTYKNTPWVKYESEMIKKTVIKRAHKTLPPSRGTEIMGEAIKVINEHEGIEFKTAEILYTDDEFNEYKRCVDEKDFINLAALISFLDPSAQNKLKQLCFPESERGNKQKDAAVISQALKEGRNVLESACLDLVALTQSGDDLQEIIDELSAWGVDYVCQRVDSETEIEIRKTKSLAA